MTLTIAVIGTGILGRVIAERLQGAGCTVVVFGRTASKALTLQTHGIAVVSTAELGSAIAVPSRRGDRPRFGRARYSALFEVVSLSDPDSARLS